MADMKKVYDDLIIINLYDILAIRLNQEQSDLTSTVNATYLHSKAPKVLLIQVSTYS